MTLVDAYVNSGTGSPYSLVHRAVTLDAKNAQTTVDTPTEALVIKRRRVVRDLSGNEVVSETQILVKTEPSPEDRYLVDGQEFGIARIDPKGVWTVDGYMVTLI